MCIKDSVCSHKFYLDHSDSAKDTYYKSLFNYLLNYHVPNDNTAFHGMLNNKICSNDTDIKLLWLEYLKRASFCKENEYYELGIGCVCDKINGKICNEISGYENLYRSKYFHATSIIVLVVVSYIIYICLNKLKMLHRRIYSLTPISKYTEPEIHHQVINSNSNYQLNFG